MGPTKGKWPSSNENYHTTMKPHPLIPIIIVGISVTAFAQGRPQGPPQGPPPDPLAVALDTNHDHELSAREIENAVKSLLKLDKDDDNSISAEELKPERPRGARRHHDDEDEDAPLPPKSEILSGIDSDGDGILSKAELAAAPEKLLTLDEDGDGKIDDSEAKSLSMPDRDHDGPPSGDGEGGQGRPPRGPRR